MIPIVSYAPYAAASSVALTTAAYRYFALKTIKLADIGEGTFEAELLEWFVKPGDHVKQFDDLAKVQTDKATAEIPSQFEGTIVKLHHEISDMAAVGQPFVDIEVEGDVIEPTKKKKKKKKLKQSKDVVSAVDISENSSFTGDSSKFLASPAVRSMIMTNNLNNSQIKSIQPSGPNGRITKTDLVKYLENPVPPQAPHQSQEKSILSTSSSTQHIPVRGLTRTMIKTMEASLQIPHFGLSDEINMNNLIHLRETQLKPLAEQRQIKLTYMPIFIKACSSALKEFPRLNSSLSADKQEIIQYAHHHIGVAMDTPAGLIVPNIKNVEQKSIIEISSDLVRLQQLGSEGNLGEEDLLGTTFSLSNVGMIGGNYTHPVIAPPQVAIGAFGAIQRVPRFISSDSLQVEAVNILPVSWNADHRIIDGATLARFSSLWKQYLENPAQLFVDLH